MSFYAKLSIVQSVYHFNSDEYHRKLQSQIAFLRYKNLRESNGMNVVVYVSVRKEQ